MILLRTLANFDFRTWKGIITLKLFNQVCVLIDGSKRGEDCSLDLLHL